VFTGGGKLGFQLFDGATGLVHEAAQIPRHTRCLLGTEDHQQEERYNYQFLWTYAEHAISYRNLRFRRFNLWKK